MAFIMIFTPGTPSESSWLDQSSSSLDPFLCFVADFFLNLNQTCFALSLADRWICILWRCWRASPRRAPFQRKQKRPTMSPPSSLRSAPMERTGWSTDMARITRYSRPRAGTCTNTHGLRRRPEKKSVGKIKKECLDALRWHACLDMHPRASGAAKFETEYMRQELTTRPKFNRCLQLQPSHRYSAGFI